MPFNGNSLVPAVAVVGTSLTGLRWCRRDMLSVLGNLYPDTRTSRAAALDAE
jgi:hypothetical protein